MEVHTHSHPPPEIHRGRKKWTHYFWEFFMLFLAVTLGFFVENQREHLIEHKREKQYIKSMIADLRTDTTNLSAGNRWFNQIIKASDTLLKNYIVFTKGYSQMTYRNYSYILSGYPDFVYTDRTMQQLKNAGGLRLIRNVTASDSIVDYDANIRDLFIEESSVTFYYDRIHDQANKVFNFRKFDSLLLHKKNDDLERERTDFWLTNNVAELEQLYNQIREYRNTIFSYAKYRVRLQQKAGRLIDLLKREYHLE